VPGRGRPWREIDCRAAAANSVWVAVAPAEQTSTGCRHWWSGTVTLPPSTPMSTVKHCAYIGLPSLLPPSTPFIEIMSVHPCLLRTGEKGWRGGGRRIKDVNKRPTSLEIIYAAWHVLRCDVCIVCMPFCPHYCGFPAVTAVFLLSPTPCSSIFEAC